MKGKRLTVSLVTFLALLLMISGCGSKSGSNTDSNAGSGAPASQTNESPSPSESQPAAPAETKKVKMAVLPYFDYTLYVAAHALGVDKEQGIDLELIPFPGESQAVQALLNGSIDVAQGAMGSFVPLLPNAADLRVVLNNNQFKGFVYIGRKGELKSFEEVLKEDRDFAKAQKATLEQLKGKKFMMVESAFSGMLKSALEQVGMKYEDVKIMNFQSDAQAATAFLRGEGDVYTGSLPQQMKILKEPGYVAVAGNEVLGSSGLWFSNTAVTKDYLEKNRETVDKLVAIHYRMTRYLQEKMDDTIPPMIDYVAKNASSNLTFEDAVQMIKQFVIFNTLEESKAGVYSPDAPTYWKKAAELFVMQNEELGKIPKGSVNIDEVVQQENIFNEVSGNQALADWINSPIK